MTKMGTKVKIEKADLIATAKDLNETMGLKPAINVKLDTDKIVDGVKKAVKAIDWESDEAGELDEKTLKTLSAMGLIQLEEDDDEDDAPVEKKDTKKDKGSKKDKPAPEPDPEEDEDEDDEEEEEEDEDDDEDEISQAGVKEWVEDAETLKDLKELVATCDEFKSLRAGVKAIKNAEDLREMMLDILSGDMEKEVEAKPAKKGAEKKDAPKGKKESEAKPAKKEKAQAAEKFSRIAAMATILKDDPKMDADKAIKAADALYTKTTGKESNLKEQAGQYSRVMTVFNVMEIA